MARNFLTLRCPTLTPGHNFYRNKFASFCAKNRLLCLCVLATLRVVQTIMNGRIEIHLCISCFVGFPRDIVRGDLPTELIAI